MNILGQMYSEWGLGRLGMTLLPKCGPPASCGGGVLRLVTDVDVQALCSSKSAFQPGPLVTLCALWLERRTAQITVCPCE